jgi:hypothetical protein
MQRKAIELTALERSRAKMAALPRMPRRRALIGKQLAVLFALPTAAPALRAGSAIAVFRSLSSPPSGLAL